MYYRRVDHDHVSEVTAAGGSAFAEYEHLRGAWITRNRRLFCVLDTAVAVIVVAGVMVRLAWPWTAWYGGLTAGAALAFDLSVRMNPPGWIQNWHTGGIGEQRTARALSALPPDWTVIHDRPIDGRGNIDHVVIGPGGVFVLETKNITAETRVDGDTLTVYRSDGQRRYTTTNPARQARGNAAALSRELTGAGVRCWVHAVVVIWGDFPQQMVHGDHVLTVHGAHLAAALEKYPPRLAQSRLKAATAILTRPSTATGRRSRNMP